MAHRIIQQARGRGGPRYRAPSFNYFGKISYAFPENKLLAGEVIDIVNSVGHSEPLMIIEYENGRQSLLPASLGIKKGEKVFAGPGAPITPGNVVRLGQVPTGIPVYNIEREPFDGGSFVRTSGTFAQVIGAEGGKVVLRMPSKREVALNPDCRATIGVVAGGGRTEKPWVKGGKRHAARRARGKLHPVVSGVAMNAVDHPFGGSHRRSLGVPTTTSRWAPPGRKVGLIAARKTGRGK